jgi:adenine deaminase
MIIEGNIVDPVLKEIYPAEISIVSSIINIKRVNRKVSDQYILPGFIDAHIHIESSLMSPSSFSNLIIKYGTVAIVADPHEIANVCGESGLSYMVKDSLKAKNKIFFGLPSCVPSLSLDSSGADLNSDVIEKLIQSDDFYFLAEMMNYPGVVSGDLEVLKKLYSALKCNKPIDGHAPGLSGQNLERYIHEGISTDHECISVEEAEEKIKLGLKILIREGSAAKNFDALLPLIEQYSDSLMFCSDDMHPDISKNGHINNLVRRAIEKGYSLFDILKIACVNPVKHYKLPVGLLQDGDLADFIVVDNLKEFNIQSVFVNGVDVLNNKINDKNENIETINNFLAKSISLDDLIVKPSSKYVNVICAQNDQLFTQLERIPVWNTNSDKLEASKELDIQKLVVLNRYQEKECFVCFVKGFGFEKGAIASSVAHDNHNIVATGTDDESILMAINEVVSKRGGLSVAFDGRVDIMELPIAGLMSNKPYDVVFSEYAHIQNALKQLSPKFNSSFMTLSFLSLLVIPEVKACSKGLFNVNKFEFIPLFS